ncbi:hypothetical protein F4553_001860 [Allocatelliglobosispora scoriae]|uniref:Uncharacterized protein n=1 Tax=Allocatelliglobosispora scoriae TaxID=643052 RepID=A0A841BNS9_9ACTN|nr:hypothetical protein [Allocatelliglobosispora scoriae]MBB5868481.1 hypothetical protein [Allocatelliglobosispora scoriae]
MGIGTEGGLQPTEPEPSRARSASGAGGMRGLWRRLDTGAKAATILGGAALLVATLQLANDVIPFRDGSGGRTAAPTASPAATRSAVDPVCANGSAPTLAVFAAAAPDRLVFQGDGFPPNSAVAIDLYASSDPAAAAVATAGTARADGGGKFSLPWVVPASLKSSSPMTALAVASGAGTGQEACRRASTQIDVARLVGSPLRIASVEAGPGETAGSPNVVVTITGSLPPPPGRIYWLCAVTDGEFHPKQSVSASDTVTTSLGSRGAWQLVVVEAGAQGSAVLQEALGRDGFTDRLPTDTRIISDQVSYQVTQS